MAPPIVRTEAQILQAEALLQASIAELPVLLRNYDADSSSDENGRALVQVLSDITRNQNYTNQSFIPETEGSAISRKMLGQILNLPVSMKRDILGLEDSVDEPAVDQAFHYWMSSSPAMLDKEGRRVPSDKGQADRPGFFRRLLGAERSERNVQRSPAAQTSDMLPEYLRQKAEIAEEGKSVEYNTDGFKAILGALEAGRTMNTGLFSDLLLNQVFTNTGAEYSPLPDSAVNTLRHVLPNLKIHSLDLSYLPLGGRQLRAVLNAVKGSPYIAVLTVGELSDRSTNTLADVIREKTALTEVHINRELEDASKLLKLVDALEDNARITEFKVADLEGMGGLDNIAPDALGYNSRGKSVPLGPLADKINLVLERNKAVESNVDNSAPATPISPTQSRYLAARSSTPSSLGSGASSPMVGPSASPAPVRPAGSYLQDKAAQDRAQLAGAGIIRRSPSSNDGGLNESARSTPASSPVAPRKAAAPLPQGYSDKPAPSGRSTPS